MRFDDSGIMLVDLAVHLRQVYGLAIVTLRFTPKGKEAYCYVASGPADVRHFVRVQRDGGGTEMEAVYGAVAALRHDGGLGFALAPLRTVSGQFTSHFGHFRVAVFPFVLGTTAYETVVSPAEWGQIAEIIAGLHESGRRCAVPIPDRETFDNPFAPTIQAAMRRAASPEAPASICQRRLIALLREQQADLTRTLGRVRDLGIAVRLAQPELVPTHGDPNLANILIGEDGSLHLTDWGELAWGPRERDLWHFSEERFEPFLRRYLEFSGRVRLHRDLFAFYAYRWVVQEIADYSARIFDDGADPSVAAHAWEELQPYLPTRHRELAAGLDAISGILARLGAEGLLEIDETM